MKKSNFFWVLAIAMMALTQSVWGAAPHFCLIGEHGWSTAQGDGDLGGWGKKNKSTPVFRVYNYEASKFYVEIDITNGTQYTFAFNNSLNNGDNGDRYAPIDVDWSNNKKNKVLTVDALANPGGTVTVADGSTDAGYNTVNVNGTNRDISDNSWCFTANYTGKLLIVVDESENEWFPKVWLERPDVSKKFYLIGEPISKFAGNFWNADNTDCPLENKNAEGKYYVNLYLENGKSFALTHSGKRFAPASSMEVSLNTTYVGSVLNGQDNSWKYTGETGLVRLVFNVSDSSFTLEPWQMYLIGNPAQDQEGKDKWDVKNTSTPLSTSYVNAEGNTEAGKFCCEVLLDKNACFAFSDGILRYANYTATENKDIKLDEAVQQGAYELQSNSWKFVDAASYVRVCIDCNNPKPYIWLEWLAPKEVYPIGTATTYGWELNDSEALTRVEGEKEMVYSGTLTLKAGELKFLCQKGFSTHYGPDTTATAGVAMNAVGEYDMVLYKNGSPDNKWNNTLEGEYIVTLNVETLKLTVEKPGTTTLVETTSVFNDNIVYDIMGRALGTSVENLPQGIYVRNGKKFVVAQ